MAAVLVTCRFLRPSPSQKQLKICSRFTLALGCFQRGNCVHCVGEGGQSSSVSVGAETGERSQGLGR